MEKTYIDSVNETPREAVMRLYGAIGPRVDGDYFAQELASLDRGDFDMIHIKGGRMASLFFLYNVIRLLCTHITDKTVYPGNQKIDLTARSSAK